VASIQTKTISEKSRAILLVLLFLFSVACQFAQEQVALAETTIASPNDEFSRQYTENTKKLVMAGVELERFSLKYRLASTKQPKFRRLRYFLAQEAGAAGILVFEVTGDKQFGTGRDHPLQINKSALHAAFATALTGSVIAGSGSLLELGSNAALAYKNKRLGYDPRTANRVVAEKLKEVDRLLAERDALVAAHSDSPAYNRAVAEGKVFRQIRNSAIAEYATFHSDVKGFATYSNCFYLLNALTNALAATGVGIGYKAVNTPKLNAPTNIIFIVVGGLIMAVPTVSSVAGLLMRRHAYESFSKQIGEKPEFDFTELSAARKQLKESESTAEGTLIPTLPAVDRLALYADSEQLYKKQILSETTVSRHLEKVALENSLLAPLVGGTIMTQGILGSVGYFRYTFRPRPQLKYAFYGAVVGTVGGGIAVGGNAASFLASYAYEYHLRKEHRLPSQLIEERLSHLDDVEKIAQSM